MDKYELAMIVIALLTLIVTALNTRPTHSFGRDSLKMLSHFAPCGVAPYLFK
jgi:hypothetical protein